MSSAPVFIEKIIRERKIVLFSKTYSPECQKVKEILALHRQVPKEAVTVIEIEKRSDCSEVEDYLLKLSSKNRREVPLLFIRGHFFGGYEDILRLDAERQLADLIAHDMADDDARLDRSKMDEVVVTYAKVDRTEVVVRFNKDLSMVPPLDRLDEEKECYHSDSEGRWFNPWLSSSLRSDSSLDNRSFLVEASSSLHTMRRDKSSTSKVSPVTF